MATDLYMVFVQLVVVGSVIAALLTYLLRRLVCKAKNDVAAKAVLITGCDTGIGHALARHLDSLGAHVFAGCVDTSSESAQRLRTECSPFLRLVNMDVTNEMHVAHAVGYVAENLPAGEHGLYAVINNAGVCVCGELDWQTWPQIQKQIDVNLMGTVRVIKHFLPLLKAAQGRIINVSSVAGVLGYPGLSMYCATKHAVEGVSAVIREELAKFGIAVVTVQPGDFSRATKLLQNHHRNMNEMWNAMNEFQREEYKDFFVSYHNGVAAAGMSAASSGGKAKPMPDLPKALIKGFEKAILTKVPDAKYLILPDSWSWLKMWWLWVLPSSWSQSLVSRRYRRATHPTASTPLLAHSSFRSNASTISSVSTCTTASTIASRRF